MDGFAGRAPRGVAQGHLDCPKLATSLCPNCPLPRPSAGVDSRVLPNKQFFSPNPLLPKEPTLPQQQSARVSALVIPTHFKFAGSHTHRAVLIKLWSWNR